MQEIVRQLPTGAAHRAADPGSSPEPRFGERQGLEERAVASVAEPIPDPTARPVSAIPFLDGITIDYGPRTLLAGYLAAANELIRSRGLTLTFEPLATLVAINRAKRATWIPLLPLFDPECGAVDDEGFCIIARDRSGRVMATQAGRFFNWAGTNFKHEAERLSLFYADPGAMRRPGEACHVTVDGADAIAGLVLFSGGVWIDPQVRGTGLTEVLPRISRALAIGRWSCDRTMTFFARGVANGGVPQRAGYRSVAYHVKFENNHLAGVEVGLGVIPIGEAIEDLRWSLERLVDTQVDAVFEGRTREQPGPGLRVAG
ncbi:MAG: hypothetical protein ACFCUN_08720 [Hyphomicrobiaceae bacterium]